MRLQMKCERKEHKYDRIIHCNYDFVRNIDLAWDMGSFLLEKLGMEGQAEKFSQAFDKVSNILF